MKIWGISSAVLAALLALSLLNSAYLSRCCGQWHDQLVEIDEYVQQEDWPSACEKLKYFTESWNKQQTYLHIVIEHQEIDNAQALIEKGLVLAQEADASEFRVNNAELFSQLTLLDEMERLSIKNVL